MILIFNKGDEVTDVTGFSASLLYISLRIETFLKKRHFCHFCHRAD